MFYSTKPIEDIYLEAYNKSAEDFAVWLENNSYLNWIGEGNDVNSMSAKEALAEWQKGQGK